jgi:hypothetical protein
VGERHAARVLLRRFGPRALLAKSAGRWSVIIMHQANYGSGVTITDQCCTVSRAVSQAIQYAIAERVGIDPVFGESS